MAQFSVDDAQTDLSRLIADALAGGEVVIVRDRVPLVRLVPVRPPSSSPNLLATLRSLSPLDAEDDMSEDLDGALLPLKNIALYL